MTANEIKMLIQQGENLHVEFKYSENQLSNSIWETYSAFANTDGGTIILGIKEVNSKFKIAGVRNVSKTISEIWNQVNNTEKVSVNILFDNDVYPVKIDDKTLIVIEIPAANRQEKPVFLKNDMIKYSYRRNHEGDYKCSMGDIKSMLRDQSEISIDTTIATDVQISDLITDTFRRYRNRFKNLKPNHIWNNLNDTEFLFKLGAIRRKNNVLQTTYAGVLMFANENIITTVLPNYFLDYREIDYNENARWIDRIYSSSGDWSGNIFDFYFLVTQKLQTFVKKPFLLQEGIRVEENELQEALREALANTLIHTDYNGKQGVVILKYNNSVEFQNPGLYRIPTASAIEGGVSDPRNMTIFKMFNLVGIGERSGSGVSSIHYIWKKLELKKPQIIFNYSPDRLIFKLHIEKSSEKTQKGSEKTQKGSEKTQKGSEKTQKGSEKTQKGSEKTSDKILKLLSLNNNITISELSDKLNISTRAIEKHLAKLKQKGLIKRIGSDKSGYWEVLTSKQ